MFFSPHQKLSDEHAWAAPGRVYSTPQGPLLYLDLYTTGAVAAPGHVYTTGAFAAPGACLHYRSLCCTWTCLNSKSLEMYPLGDLWNSVHGRNHGIPQNFVQLCHSEFREIPRNFRQFRTEYGSYGSTKNKRNSVLTEFRVDAWWNSVDTLIIK